MTVCVLTVGVPPSASWPLAFWPSAFCRLVGYPIKGLHKSHKRKNDSYQLKKTQILYNSGSTSFCWFFFYYIPCRFSILDLFKTWQGWRQIQPRLNHGDGGGWWFNIIWKYNVQFSKKNWQKIVAIDKLLLLQFTRGNCRN